MCEVNLSYMWNISCMVSTLGLPMWEFSIWVWQTYIRSWVSDEVTAWAHYKMAKLRFLGDGYQQLTWLVLERSECNVGMWGHAMRLAFAVSIQGQWWGHMRSVYGVRFEGNIGISTLHQNRRAVTALINGMGMCRLWDRLPRQHYHPIYISY